MALFFFNRPTALFCSGCSNCRCLHVSQVEGWTSAHQRWQLEGRADRGEKQVLYKQTRSNNRMFAESAGLLFCTCSSLTYNFSCALCLWRCSEQFLHTFLQNVDESLKKAAFEHKDLCYEYNSIQTKFLLPGHTSSSDSLCNILEKNLHRFINWQKTQQTARRKDWTVKVSRKPFLVLFCSDPNIILVVFLTSVVFS